MKQKADKISISRKVSLIFWAIVVIEVLVFVISLSFTMRNLKRDSTYSIIETRIGYTTELAKMEGIGEASSLMIKNQNTSAAYYYIETEQEHFVYELDFLEYLSEDDLYSLITSVEKEGRFSFESLDGTIYYMTSILDDGSVIVIASDGSSLNDSLFQSIVYIIVIFLLILVVGSIVVMSSINSIVKRINRLKVFVEQMPQNDYRNSYIDDGDDEIETLSQQIDLMRVTITQDENNRDLMLQNISHDLKTPIAVIRSYAEAIGDGIEDVSKINVIVNQSEKLQKKVKNLIEFNKLSHLRHQGEFEEVAMKPIIEEVVLNCKYIADINFELDLDDTKFIGKTENYATVVENIIENSTRYAKELIKITLKDGVLKISNDGEPIAEDFIKNGFKPYEKGHKGKFGLGMSIVARTLEYFDMNLVVQNEPDDKGVTFIISAK